MLSSINSAGAGNAAVYSAQLAVSSQASANLLSDSDQTCQLLKAEKDTLSLSSSYTQAKTSNSSSTKLTANQEKLVSELEKRDQEVKSHEAAHIAAAGGLAGGATYTYTTGPDGKQYATGGEVHIDISVDTSNIQQSIQKMETVKRAALAPVDPSSQDRRVASEASQTENELRSELNSEKTSNTTTTSAKSTSDEIKKTTSKSNELITELLNAYKANQESKSKSANSIIDVSSNSQSPIASLNGAQVLGSDKKSIYAYA